jgi:outer membrane receptor protein involved in Fe transport
VSHRNSRDRSAAARPLTVLGALLMTTAFTAPAFAQIETVVVTAERKAEDLQSVPIAVSAFTSQDLKAKQITSYRDLQYYTPSVTYTKSNFGGAQFQIRGITTQFGLGAAIAQNIDDVYLEAPGLVTGEYYDVDRIEVARGPQSTSYGRAATGGAVNVITSKPDLDNFEARASVDYGTYDTVKPDAMINIPVIDGQLAVRLALHGDWNSGYEKNVYAGPTIFPGQSLSKHINGLGTMAGRASVRWEPDSDTTIDLVADLSHENDSRVRGDKQLCHRDPSGVLGCLPDQLANQSLNANATLSSVLASNYGLTALGIPPNLALFNYSNPNAASQAGSGFGADVPADLLTVDTPFEPKTIGNGQTYVLNWQQKLADWLSSTVDVGYETGTLFTQQSYNDVPPDNISTNIATAVANFNGTLPFVGKPGPGNVPCFFTASCTGNPAPYDAAYFNVPGSLPLSGTNYHGTFGSYGGIIDTTRGGILTKTPYNAAYDEENFGNREWTGEVRFQTAFEGPLNFTAGAFYMSFNERTQYWVAAPTLDYDAIVIGAISGNATAGVNGLVFGTPTFDSESRNDDILSRSAFLEGTYEAIPDLLKFTVGARYNDDRDHTTSTFASLLGAGFFPIGSTTVSPIFVPQPLQATTAANAIDPSVQIRKVYTTDKWTGRALVDYTPKLDFTDQTLIYVSASRGELAGGVNTANVAGTIPAAPTIYQPATVDALELGTKNTLFDGRVQENLTAWYYNYENYQLGIIANRNSQVLNIPAHLFGLENETIWQPTDQLTINFTLSLTQSQAGNASFVDSRNPGAGSPNAIVIKDVTNGSNCVIVRTTAPAGATPASVGVPDFFHPNGGNDAVDAPYGVPYVNYGVCQPGLPTKTPTGIRAALLAAGFDYAPQTNPKTGAPVANAADITGVAHDGLGIPVNLHGNQLPDVPRSQVGVGVQYSFNLPGSYTLVPRIDYYWQSSMESRVWNDANIDRIDSWDVMNASIQLNQADSGWYTKLFVTNVFDKRNPTGEYLTDPTSALFTNTFVEDPRVVGVSLGASW